LIGKNYDTTNITAEQTKQFFSYEQSKQPKNLQL